MSEMLDAVRAAIVSGLLKGDADGVISNSAVGLVLDGRFDLDILGRTVIDAIHKVIEERIEVVTRAMCLETPADRLAAGAILKCLAP